MPVKKVKKIIYFGAHESGKLTNLKQICHQIGGKEVVTKSDHLGVSVHLLSVDLGSIEKDQIELHLATSPGYFTRQTFRDELFEGAHGCIFVADSRPQRFDANFESWRLLRMHLKMLAKANMPAPKIVVQLNKCDFKDALPKYFLKQSLGLFGYPCFEAIATSQRGVLEPIIRMTKMLLC